MPLVDKRYAEALVDVAEEKQILDMTQSELQIFAEMYRLEPGFERLFLAPEIGKEEKKKTLQNMFKGSNSIILPFLQLLIDKGRMSSLPGIYKEYVDIANKRKKVLNMKIWTYAPIDDAQLERIKEKFKNEYNATDVKAAVSIEPELLGGIIVQIGDRVIDGSIRGRLIGLERSATRA